MKGADEQPLGLSLADQLGHACTHLARRFVGEGHRQDRLGSNTPCEQIGDAHGHDAGLARAGTGQDQDRSLCGSHGQALFGIESGENLQGARSVRGLGDNASGKCSATARPCHWHESFVRYMIRHACCRCPLASDGRRGSRCPDPCRRSGARAVQGRSDAGPFDGAARRRNAEPFHRRGSLRGRRTVLRARRKGRSHDLRSFHRRDWPPRVSAGR